MGACHITLGTECLGAYHSARQNGYLGAYPGVGACPGYYGDSQKLICFVLGDAFGVHSINVH